MTDSQLPPDTLPEDNREAAPEEYEPNRDPLGDRLVIIIVLMVLFMFLIATGFLFIVARPR